MGNDFVGMRGVSNKLNLRFAKHFEQENFSRFRESSDEKSFRYFLVTRLRPKWQENTKITFSFDVHSSASRFI